jgi:uncharacterized protein YuzE
MKLNYNRTDDVLTIETSSGGVVDHAEQTDSLIAHFSREGQLLVLEILDASDFLSSLVKVAVKGQEQELPLVTR